MPSQCPSVTAREGVLSVACALERVVVDDVAVWCCCLLLLVNGRIAKMRCCRRQANQRRVLHTALERDGSFLQSTDITEYGNEKNPLFSLLCKARPTP